LDISRAVKQAAHLPYIHIYTVKDVLIYMTHIKQYKMNNNSIFSDSFMQFLCIIYAFYARFMHELYAYFYQFVKGYYEPDIKITGI
jgi:hypothetical protein